MFSSSLYRSSPVWLQEFLIAARGFGRIRLREGKSFERFATEAERTQWLSPDELERYRRRYFNEIVGRAVQQVPYYREGYRGIDRRAGDWYDVRESLPLLDKTAVRNAARSLLSEGARHPLFEGSTSGTTGAPLKLMQDLAAVSRENAFIWRQLRWAGWVPGARRAWIRGDMAVPASQSEPPYWRHNAAERMLILSSYHLSASTAPAYLESLSSYGPALIQAYPSSIGFLASYLESTSRFYEGPALSAIVTSSETLAEPVRALIEERFGCRVFDWYGQFERVAAVGTCERGTLHIVDDYSLVEFVPVDAGLHELVGTGFNNAVMPLIRYRTGDLVELAAPTFRCPCGRQFRAVRRIIGRDDDPVKLRDGRVIGRLDHIFKGVDGLLDAQIRQDSLDEVCIHVVPSPGWSGVAQQQIERKARERLGNAVAIRVETVDSIERGRNGKYRRVVCNV